MSRKGNYVNAWFYKRVCRSIVVALALLVSCLFAAPTQQLNKQQVVSALSKRYGERAALRANAWFNIIDEAQQLSDIDKLNKVNNFFNLFNFVEDKKLWGESNYWATPLEFIGVNGGDCEDYTIAKYFTLIELGIANEKMRMTMVKAVHLNQYHMVLAYYETPSAMPLILDNLDGVIKKASKRKDLIPIYSFNASQLWLNKEKGRGVLTGKSSKIKPWRELKQRMTTSKLKQPKFKMEF